ncbi:MAG: CHAT domain-containing protein [Planctomycetota bacterium]|nr:CHAT domain-containing protein [Planctomycetota bacterium]
MSTLRTRPGRWLLGLAGVLVTAAPLRAEDAPTTPAGKAAAAVIRAFDAGEQAAVGGSSKVDPWHVVEELWSAGRLDAARAFAAARGSEVDAKALTAYVASRAKAEIEPNAQAAFRQLGRTSPAGYPALTEPFRKAPLDRVATIALARARVGALTSGRRLAEARPLWGLVADAARDLGWIAMEEEALLFGGFVSYRLSDLAAARAAWNRRLPLLEKLGLTLDIARTHANLGNVHQAAGEFEQALASFQRAHDMFVEAGAEALAGSVLNNMGTLLRRQGKHAESLPLLEKAYAAAVAAGDKPRQARALHNLANALGTLGRAEEALAKLEASLVLRRTLDDPAGLAKGLHSLASVHLELAERAEAHGLLTEALALARRSAQPALVAHVLKSLASTESLAGHNKEAAEALTEVLRIQEGLGVRPALTHTLILLAGAERAQGNVAAARRHEGAALKNAESVGDPVGAAKARIEIAKDLTGQAKPAEALAMLESALATIEPTGNVVSTVMVLNALADVREHTGDTPRARAMWQRAADLSAKAGFVPGQASALNNLGLSLVQESRFEDARALYERVVKLNETMDDDAGLAIARTNLSRVHAGLGNLAQAVALAKQAAAAHADGNRPREAAVTWANLSSTYAQERMHAEALAAAERALPFLERVDDAWVTGQVHFERAQALHNLGRGREAIPILLAVAEELQQTFAGLGAEQGAQARTLWRRVPAVGAIVAWHDGSDAQLFKFLELGRAAGLLESLGAEQGIVDALLPADLRVADRALRARELEAHEALAKARRRPGRRARAGARKQLLAIQAERELLTERMERAMKAASGVVAPEIVDLLAYQATLAPDEAFVTFLMDENLELALVVTRDVTRRVVLGMAGAGVPDDAPAPIAPRVAAWVAAVETSEGAGVAVLDEARRRLVEPLAIPAAIKRLHISPDGPLGYLPFAWLFPDPSVAYVPSATAAVRIAKAHAGEGTGVLALGDPDYGQVRAGARARHRGGRALPPLPATRKEVEAITKAPLLGAAATETKFVEALRRQPRWRAVHLACHGLVDEEHPLRSSLAVTPDENSDGFLSCLDIARVRVPADLVVLSACESGKGRTYASEGILGLTRSFLVSGARAVLCSLWKVDDEATQALMVRFYALWHPKEGQGIPAAAALRQAQAHVRAQPQWAHPYYWGAWVIWGAPTSGGG